MREVGCLRCRRRIARKKYNTIHKEVVYKKNKEWFLDNPEKRKHYTETERSKRIANPQKSRDTVKRYRKAHPAIVQGRVSAWKSTHRSRVNEWQFAWKKRNPERVRLSNLPGRLRRRGNANRSEIKEFMIENLMWRGGYYCEKCGRELSLKEKNILHIDHVVPLVKGGGGNKENLQLLCQRCNLVKGIKIEDYRTSLFLGEANV
jgi:5-methylcytosine-specific restriction endonuclease McrA